MNGVDPDRLDALYAGTDDPWDFRTSAYERAKFAATVAALPRPRYASALEIGCGNGELARRIAPRCTAYHGLDAVDRALAAARRAVPSARFDRLFLPDRLPDGAYDLIVLSEILYFLDADAIADLAGQVGGRWPKADVICVTWLGPSGNPLEGAEALDLFRAAFPGKLEMIAETPDYRIDVAEATG